MAAINQMSQDIRFFYKIDFQYKYFDGFNADLCSVGKLGGTKNRGAADKLEEATRKRVVL